MPSIQHFDDEDITIHKILVHIAEQIYDAVNDCLFKLNSLRITILANSNSLS